VTKNSHLLAVLESHFVSTKLIEIKNGKTIRNLGIFFEKLDKSFGHERVDLIFMGEFVDLNRKRDTLKLLHFTVHISENYRD
jgi:hypothetical protein